MPKVTHLETLKKIQEKRQKAKALGLLRSWFPSEELLKEVYSIISSCTKESPITSKELLKRLRQKNIFIGLSSLADCIKVLRREKKYLIASSKKKPYGYYIPHTIEEKMDMLKRQWAFRSTVYKSTKVVEEILGNQIVKRCKQEYKGQEKKKYEKEVEGQQMLF